MFGCLCGKQSADSVDGTSSSPARVRPNTKKDTMLERALMPKAAKVKPRDAARVLAASRHLESNVREQLIDLGQRIQGQVYLAPENDPLGETSPQAKAYHKQRERPFYINDCNYPSAIVVAETADDVAQTVKLAASLLENENNNNNNKNDNDDSNSSRRSYKLCIAGGCHSAYCMVEHSIVLDMQKMNKVTVDKPAKTVLIQGGTKISEAHAALRGTGLSIVTGTNGDTGVSGLTLAGGAGFLGGQAGYACDTVLAAEVVMPLSGEIVTATDTNEYKDLLRALRGGGGNFGVVTEWKFKLFDVSSAFGGVIAHFVPTVTSLRRVLDNYFEILREIPDAGWSSLGIQAGMPLAGNFLTVIGKGTENAKTYKDIPFLAKSSKLGAWLVVKNNVCREDYFDGIVDMMEPFQQRTFGVVVGVMVYSLDADLRDAIIHFTRVDYPKRNTEALIGMQSLTGEMSRNDGSRSSIRHRKAMSWILIEARWRPNSTDKQIQEVKDWAIRAKSKIVEMGGEDGPHNFCDTDGRRITFFTHEQRAFLHKAKQKYDPNNLLTLNKNIISHTE